MGTSETLGRKIVDLGGKNGMNVSAFGGGSSSARAGHMLQIFVKRNYADVLAYIFQLNGLPTGGDELPNTSSLLGRIRIEWGNEP